MLDSEAILRRIDELIVLTDGGDSIITGPTVYAGTLQLVSLLYGHSSHQVDVIKEIHKRNTGYHIRSDLQFRNILQELKGVLENFRREVEHGLITTIQKEAQGEILADFIALAKDALNQGSKDVAAVLVSAALEDSLKKYARSHGLDVDDKDMSEVIGLLKSNQLLKQPESKIVQSYVTFRNKALHAEWEKIGEPEVSSAIGYVERFLLSHF